MTRPSPEPSLVQSAETLEAIASAARAQEAVALDTEFVWQSTYYPRASLVQVGWSQADCHLIDVLALQDLGPLAALLRDEETWKILHDAPQDLMLLQRWTGVAPVRVFDTRLAAGFAGFSATTSLVDLLRDVLGIELSKSQSRTDWCQRPLSTAQRQYALDDVRYLVPLRARLLELAQERGNASRLAEDLEAGPTPTDALAGDPREQWRRVKGARRLTPGELAILREVAAWREAEARRADRPRRWILSDSDLLALARTAPEARGDLQERAGLSDKVVRRCGAAILAAVKHGCHAPAEAMAATPPAVDKQVRSRVDELLKAIQQKAAQEELDPTLVGSRAQLTALFEPASGGDASALRRGWRAAFLKPLLNE